MVVKRHYCYVKVTSSCDIASHRFQGLLDKKNGEQEKESIICVRVG